MVDIGIKAQLNIKNLVGINGEVSFCPEAMSTRLTHASGKSSGLSFFKGFFVRVLPINRTAYHLSEFREKIRTDLCAKGMLPPCHRPLKLSLFW